ncbi:MAG: motility associated factor glycosyltransferase family protein [Spirochaetales bacterium]|nr:motility associated factor glycosyltransferase family protein [Spirochaetales bacterium]
MKSDTPELISTGNAFTVKYKGNFLYSSKDPLGNVARIIANTTIHEKTLIFIPGIGLGYGVKELLKKLPNSCFIICVEIDRNLMDLCLNHGELKDLNDKRLIILRTDGIGSVIQALSTIGVHNVRRMQTVKLSASYQLFAEYYTRIQEVLQTEIKNYWQNKMTMIFMGKLLVKNIITNLPYLAHAGDIAQVKTSLPIAVIGAGPSLDSSIRLLKEIQDRVLILVVDTALSTLCAHSLLPDFILSLEAQFINIQDFITDNRPEIPLLCDCSVSPQVMRLCKSIFCFSSQFYDLQLLKRLNQLGLLPSPIPALGSVGIAAVYCALQITSGPVLLAGLDFSYGGKKTHAKNTYFHKLISTSALRLNPAEHQNFQTIYNRPLLEIKDKKGNPLQSDLILHSYAENLSRLVALNRTRVYDISSGGLDCGAEQYDDIPKLKALLAGCKKSSFSLPGRADNKHRHHYSPAVITRFLDQELLLLQQALDLINPLLENGGETEGRFKPEEFEKLEKIDYVFFHLPHKTALPAYTKSLLQHIKAYCLYYRTKLKQAKSK